MAWSLTFDASVPSQQRAWFEDALQLSRIPWEQSRLTIVVRTVDEPPCPGHADYMCTQSDGAQHVISIRVGADDPNASFNASVKDDIHNFFVESVVHELGHAFAFQHMATSDEAKADIASWFTLETATGEGSARRGVLADWNPLDRAWEDRIQEALAEFFKDVYLPDAYRVYENRTHWWMDQAYFTQFRSMVGSVFAGTFDSNANAIYDPIPDLEFEGNVYTEVYTALRSGGGVPLDTGAYSQWDGEAETLTQPLAQLGWSTTGQPATATPVAGPITAVGGEYYNVYIYFNIFWLNDHLPDNTFLLVVDFSDIPGWILGDRPTPMPDNSVTRWEPGMVSAELWGGGEDNFDAPYTDLVLARDFPEFSIAGASPPAFRVDQDWPFGSAVKIIPVTFQNRPVRGGHYYAPFSFYTTSVLDMGDRLRLHVLFPPPAGAPPDSPWPYIDTHVAAGPGPSGVIRAMPWK